MKFYANGLVTYPGTIVIEADNKEAAEAKLQNVLEGEDPAWDVDEMDTHGYLASFEWNGGDIEVMDE